MNVKILTLVIVLVVALLCSASAGPMASREQGRDVEEGAPHGDQSRTPPRGQSHRPAGWKRRRPDPASLTRGQCRSREGIALAALPQVLIFCALPLSMGGLQQWPCGGGRI